MRAPSFATVARVVLALAVGGCSASAGCSLSCDRGGEHDLTALCGTWQSRGKDDEVTEERWTWSGEELVGEAITRDRHGVERSHESITIRRVDGRTIYRATPDGATPTEFKELRDHDLEAAEGEQIFVWEDPTHDFPKRIVYRVAAKRLEATISDPESEDEGKRRGFTWEHRRIAPCAR